MTQSTPFNNDSTSNHLKGDQSVDQFDAPNSKTTIEFPELLKQSFNKVYTGPDSLQKEYSMMLQAGEQILPNGERMSLDTYRRLYNLRFEKELPPYPDKGIWQDFPAWVAWFKLMDKRHLGALASKGGLLLVKWGAIISTLGSVSWASFQYVRTSPIRQQQANNQAWQIIHLAKETEANGGRINALENLVKNGVDLSLLSIPKANLASFDRDRKDYKGINLREAQLWRANLAESTLTKAQLEKAILRYANLKGANLEQANLAEADLRNTYLTGANLEGANLTNANLTRANFAHVNLKDANLTNANLTASYFKGQDLTGVNLKDANLRAADLTNANLTEVKQLNEADLNGTKYNDKTKFPVDFDPTRAGMQEEAVSADTRN